MIDTLLGWFVIALPFLVTVGATVLALKVPHERYYWRFVWSAIALGVIFSALTYWQQARSAKQATTDREAAIRETSKQVAKDTTDTLTKALGQQYKSLIDSLTQQVGDLKGQLATQGKKVDAIGESPFLNGKKPVRVEVTNQIPPSTSNVPPSHEGHLTVSQKQDISTRPDAPYVTAVTVQSDVDFPSLKLIIVCNHALVAANAGLTGMYRGGSGLIVGRPDEAGFQYSSASPPFGPTNSVTFRVWSTQPVVCKDARTE